MGLISNLIKITTSAKKNNIQVIYSQHENNTFLVRGSEDWEILDDIKPITAIDKIIYKNHPSIFKDTNLMDLLKQTGTTRLYIAGLISNGCVMDTCLDGLKNNYDVVLISDAHSTFYKNAGKIIADINNQMASRGITLKKCSELW
jgi:nicotinamidase-related amidase